MAGQGPLAAGTLDHEGHQGLHGESLVRALVVAAGLELSRPEPAYGKDFYIGFPGPMETIRSPRILVSVKSWRNAILGQDDSWHYKLKVSNYNFLANSSDLRPYLFLAIVPPSTSDYAEASHASLLLRQAVYWVSFENVDPVESAPENEKVVLVPRLQLLTAETLYALVKGDEAAAKVSA